MDTFKSLVEAEWLRIRDSMIISDARIAEIKAHFPVPAYLAASDGKQLAEQKASNPAFALWIKHNTVEHKIAGYRAAYISLKAPEVPPGDITDQQLELIADLADQYSFGEVRSTHRQNLLLADVHQDKLFAVWQALDAQQLATPNIGTVTDLICCPGLDFCSLANASSISVAKELNQALDDLDYLHDIGDIKINMSGCMNGCAHQSVGHIGILGVDKKGEEWYQITLGGSSENQAAIGERLGPSVAKDQIVPVIRQILDVYLEQRQE